jgi:hypothetical protein
MEIDHKEIHLGGRVGTGFNLLWDRAQWPTLVDTVMKFRYVLWPAELLSSLQAGLFFMGLVVH